MLTQEKLKELLHYDPDTGAFTWLVHRSIVKAGSIAGALTVNGYIRIQIFGTRFRAHHLAFLYMEGKFPKDCVDHINGIGIDNRWANLREATRSENNYNARIKTNNTSGYKGVSFDKHRGAWHSRVRVAGKTHCLGYHETPELASVARNEFARKHHGEFFHE